MKNLLILITALLLSSMVMAGSKPNIILFTVDDMDISSVNCYGNPLEDLTPNMDRLASEGMRFQNAHVNSPICMTCRQSMMTGLQPHSNGSFGFVEVEKGTCPSLPGLLMENGYYTVSISKGRDYKAFPWDEFINGLGAEAWYSRKPSAFYDRVKKAIKNARKAAKPFYIGVNTSDPHRPFVGSEQEKEYVANVRKKHPTANVPDFPSIEPFCSEEEVPLLAYLPDLPEIRKETVQYYTAVKRADDTLGRILGLLDEEGLSDDTLVIFLSDHAAPMPSGKQNCYSHSSATPLMFRWPSVIDAGSVDSHHMVSSLDIMPTILEALNIQLPKRLDGRSMLSILKGGTQDDRDAVFTTYNYICPGVQVFPFRAVHTREWSFVFNPWSDGERKRLQGNGNPTDNQSGLTFAAMIKHSGADPELKKRVDYIVHRKRDELFDLRKDPYSFKNLSDRVELKKKLFEMKQLLITEMERSHDPLLKSLNNNTTYPESWNVHKK